MKNFLIGVWLPYSMLLMCMVTLLSLYPQQPLHLLLNSWHAPFLDIFFRYYTQLAEWPLYLLALIPLYWKRTRILTVVYACAECLGAIVIQVLKHIIRAPRPSVVFKGNLDILNLVDGVHLHRSNSFPSGHSSTFFIFFVCCSFFILLYYNKKGKTRMNLPSIALPFVCVLLAAVGGYSRIYLSQHFLLDVCVGSFVGTVVACTCCYFFRCRLNKSLFES